MTLGIIFFQTNLHSAKAKRERKDIDKRGKRKIKATMLNQLERLEKEAQAQEGFSESELKIKLAQEMREISQQIIRLGLEEIAIPMLSVLRNGVDTNAGYKIDKKIQ